MFFTKTAVLLAVLPLSIASTCSSSNALPYTPSPSSGGNSNQAAIDAAFVTCSSTCGSTSDCLISCLDQACTSHCGTSSSCHLSCLNDPCSAFYGSGSDSPDADQLQACYKAKNSGTPIRRNLMLEARATLTCSSSETCYGEANGNLFCLQSSTGDYHDIEGGTGNVNTGEYTSAGSSSSTTTGSSSAATKASSSPAAAATSSRAASTTTSSATTLGAASSPSATKSGVEKLHANVMLGAFGLIFGLTAL